MLQLTSIFENSKLDLQYGYCQNIHDGRGYTFGFCGFVTKLGDGKKVLKAYLEQRPNDTLMASFLDIMSQPTAPGSDGTENLVGFCPTVEALGDDPAFRAAQDKMQRSIYYLPAMEWAKRIGARYALTKAQLYDAMINHGEGVQDPFSIDHIVSETNAKVGVPLEGADEIQWLSTFLDVREKMLIDQAGKQYAKRISFYRELLDGKNYNLDGPIYVTTERKGNGWVISNVYFGKFEIYEDKPISVIV